MPRLGRRSWSIVVFSVGTTVCTTVCSQGKIPPSEVADAAEPTITVAGREGLLFSFFDRRAVLRTVDEIDAVDACARAEVHVTDPRRRLPGDRIYVADLHHKNADGSYRVWTEERGAWLDRNMPKLTVLDTPPAEAPVVAAAKKVRRRRASPRRVRKLAANRLSSRDGSPSDAPVVQPAARRPQVVLFSTSWCPSCVAARDYLQKQGIPFVELDVEKDRAAAEQYVAVVQKAGLKPGAVPVIVVAGQVFQGFSPQQIQSALKQGG